MPAASRAKARLPGEAEALNSRGCKSPTAPPRRPSKRVIEEGKRSVRQGQGFLSLSSNALHLIPRPDFLRPLVPDPVYKPRDPGSALPGSKEQMHLVPFSQESGRLPLLAGRDSPLLPFPQSPPPHPPRHLPPRNPSSEARARVSPPPRQETRVPPGATTHPAPSLTLGPYPQYPLSVAPSTK